MHSSGVRAALCMHGLLNPFEHGRAALLRCDLCEWERMSGLVVCRRRCPGMGGMACSMHMKSVLVFFVGGTVVSVAQTLTPKLGRLLRRGQVLGGCCGPYAVPAVGASSGS